MKRPALQAKRVRVLGMAFRGPKVFGTFEERAPGLWDDQALMLDQEKSATDQPRKVSWWGLTIVLDHKAKSFLITRSQRHGLGNAHGFLVSRCFKTSLQKLKKNQLPKKALPKIREQFETVAFVKSTLIRVTVGSKVEKEGCFWINPSRCFWNVAESHQNCLLAPTN